MKYYINIMLIYFFSPFNYTVVYFANLQGSTFTGYFYYLGFFVDLTWCVFVFGVRFTNFATCFTHWPWKVNLFKLTASCVHPLEWKRISAYANLNRNQHAKLCGFRLQANHCEIRYTCMYVCIYNIYNHYIHTLLMHANLLNSQSISFEERTTMEPYRALAVGIH